MYYSISTDVTVWKLFALKYEYLILYKWVQINVYRQIKEWNLKNAVEHWKHDFDHNQTFWKFNSDLL